MSSRHLVDPDVLPLIEMLPPFVFEPGTLDQTRALMGMLRPKSDPSPQVAMSERMIPGAPGDPDVRVVISAPQAAGTARPGILHIHGGGYVMGAPEDGLATDDLYVRSFDAVVVSVDYRLAPETPHPGPVEDCHAALVWMQANAAELGIDPARIAVTGESAGGGLAAATCLLARDRGQVKVAFQHLVYPMLDDRTVTRTDPSPLHGQFVWTPANNLFGWTSLLGQAPGSDGISPYAAPARAEDLSGLPPTFMICGALDLFLEEDLEYARRLIRAGVQTEFHIYAGAPHAFQLASEAHVSKSYLRDSMTALGRALGVTAAWSLIPLPQQITLPGPQDIPLAADLYHPAGRHTILLTHGGGQTRHAWGATARQLASEGYRVLSKDMRGHGDSGWAPDGNYKMEAFRDDVRQTLDWINAPTILIGASLGGMASLMVAGEYPDERIRGLVLVDITPNPAPEGIARIRTFMGAHPQGFATLDEAADAVAGYQPHRERRKDASGLMKNLRERNGRLYWHWDPAFLEMVQSDPTERHSQLGDLCARITVPTLLVRGGESEIVAQKNVDEFLTLLPHAQVATVDGARHMVAGDQNTAFGDALLDFVRAVLPA